MNFWRQKKREAELEDELRSHLEMAAKARMERGADPKDAQHAARREFGNVTLVKEVARDMWGGRWLRDLVAGRYECYRQWSSTLEREGETDADSAYMVLKQEGTKLTGSVGPNESEQHAFEDGKVAGDELTFDVSLDGKSLRFELEAKGDQLMGQVRLKVEGGERRTGKISLKRIPEK